MQLLETTGDVAQLLMYSSVNYSDGVGSCVTPDAGRPLKVNFTSLPKFLQCHFFSNETGGTSFDLLAACGTYAFHFLIQSLHS